MRPTAALRRATATLGLTSSAPARVSVHGVDQTHLGIGVSIWKADVAADTDLRHVLAQRVPGKEALRSCLEVLITQAQGVAAREASCQEQMINHTAGFLFTLAHVEDRPDHARLLHEVAAQLAARPFRTRFSLTEPLIAHLADLVLSVGYTIEECYGVSVAEQFEDFDQLLLGQAA